MAIAAITAIASIDSIDMMRSQPNELTLVIGPAGRMIPAKVFCFRGMVRSHQPAGRGIRPDILQRRPFLGGARPAEKTKHDSFLQTYFALMPLSVLTEFMLRA